MRRVCLLALALILLGGPRGLAQKQGSASPLPADIVAAWSKAGARVGWLVPSEYGFLGFQAQANGTDGEVPAFHFENWHPGVLGQLPKPEGAFGLCLYRTQIADAGLKELAGLTSLQSLSLHGTKVTDAGLKDLAGLKSLQLLDLGQTGVTD